MSETQTTLIAVASIASITFLVLSMRALLKKRSLEKETRARNQRLSNRTVSSLVDDLRTQISAVESKLNEGARHYDQLQAALATSTRDVSHIEVGLLPPVFRFDDSEGLKTRIRKNRDLQYQTIRQGSATESLSNWTWFGNEKKGQEMVSAYRWLLLTAYNAEFDLIRKQMRHSSFDAALGKLDRLRDQLSRLGETAGVEISFGYEAHKQQELDAWHKELEHKEEVKQNRKKQQAILREQSKSGDSGSEDLEEELADRQALLEKVRKLALERAGDSQAAIGLEMRAVRDEIEELKQKLQRAQLQAQITRAGFIYVISNIGSFGEGVVKIGMTRRLEPLDRVRELGDASVPFKFDVHTLAFVDDAPAIENALHRKFDDRRVNKHNNRKEFFKVPVEQVQAALNALGVESDWYFEVEAKEYRESLLIRQSVSEQEASATTASSLPSSI